MSIKKKRILIVPSWYLSSFVYEQIELIKDTFDIKVLFGNRIEIGKKKSLTNFISGKLKKPSLITQNKSGLKDNSFFIEFQYIKALPVYLESKQISIINRCFEKLLIDIDNSGWTPDLIHIHSISDISIFICNWAEKNKIPVILTEHIIYIRRRFDLFQKEKEKVYNKVNKILCVSNYLYRNLLTSGFKINNAEIIGNFVDNMYAPKVFKDKTENITRILFAATHSQDKDIQTLLLTIKLLIDSDFTQFKLDIIGLEPDYLFTNNSGSLTLLNKEIEKLGLFEFITIIGYKPKEQLLKLYQKYSFLVSTSISETFGLVVAEAIMNGLPVICTDSGGIRDFVNESNGIIVPLRDPYSFCEAIKTMIQNLNKYNSKEISMEIIRKYGKDTFTKKLIKEYYSQIIDK